MSNTRKIHFAKCVMKMNIFKKEKQRMTHNKNMNNMTTNKNKVINITF